MDTQQNYAEEISTKKQYEKYKEPLRKHAVTQIVLAICSIIIVLFLLFVPIFQINFDDLNGEKALNVLLLPKFDITKDNISFSLVDEAKLIIETFKALKENGQSLFESLAGLDLFYNGIALVLYVIAVIMASVSLIKKISILGSLDDYAINVYDEMKNRQQADTSSKINTNGNVAIRLLSSGFSIQLINLILPSGSVNSYFSLITGVSGWFWLTAILIVVTIVTSIYSSNILKKVKTAILKEEYGTTTK